MASVSTRDHDEIQAWAEAHGATPSVVSRTGSMLRFEFAPEGEDNELSEVSWDDFFQAFDEKGLELVYDDKPGSRFHKLIYPETESAGAPSRTTARRSAPKPARASKRMDITPVEPTSIEQGRSRAARTTATSGHKSSPKPAARSASRTPASRTTANRTAKAAGNRGNKASRSSATHTRSRKAA